MTASPVRSMRAMSKAGTDSSVSGERGDTAGVAATAFASARAVASAAGPSSRAPDSGGETAGAAGGALGSYGRPRPRVEGYTTKGAKQSSTNRPYKTAHYA